MSYKDMSEIAILNSLGKSMDGAKSDLFETYDQIRDLTVSGPTTGGSGIGPAGGFLVKLAHMLGGSSFLPTMGSQSINIPGTSYYNPIQAGTGVVPGGQSSFGVGPMSQFSTFPSGYAAGFNPLAILSSLGTGNANIPNTGIGDENAPTGLPIGGIVAGGAAGLGYTGSGPSGVLAAGTGGAAALGMGGGFLMPAAGLVSGIGGVLTSLAPVLGKSALTGLATGTVLSGFSGALLSGYQHLSGRILTNADTELTNKVKNLETVIKQMEAQDEVIKKMLKDSLDGDKKAVQDL